jgi:hypothetical protein
VLSTGAAASTVLASTVLASTVLASTVRSAFGWAAFVIFLSWVLLFVLLIGTLVAITLMRGRRERERQRQSQVAAPTPVWRPSTASQLPARLAQLRSADPSFDEQLLLEVAQMACLLMFAAQATGDEQAIRRLTAPAFWSTFFGRYTATTARAVRQNRNPDAPPTRQTRFPVDFQAAAPELIDLELGAWQRAQIRVSFTQLRAIVSPGAEREAAAATATSLGSLGRSLGGNMNERMRNSGRYTTSLGWVSWSGRYDLFFQRPGGARTDPAAALASRTCLVCGATYRSDLTVECAHCHTERPLAAGQWQLADMTIVS